MVPNIILDLVSHSGDMITFWGEQADLSHVHPVPQGPAENFVVQLLQFPSIFVHPPISTLLRQLIQWLSLHFVQPLFVGGMAFHQKDAIAEEGEEKPSTGQPHCRIEVQSSLQWQANS